MRSNECCEDKTEVSNRSMRWAEGLRPSDSALLPALRMLRISLTDRCNFRCRYCMPSDGITKLTHDELLSLEDLAGETAWLAANLGIERVKLTGGEPLVRKGVANFISHLKRTTGIREVSMTTNGALLGHLAAELKEAGLSRVNVSLDTLEPVRFAELTRGGHLQSVLDGIHAAIENGLTPVKLNAVLQRSTWRREVPALLDFAAARGLEMRFIELMRTGTQAEWCAQEYIPASEVQKWLATQGKAVCIASSTNSPAMVMRTEWRGATMRIGWITPRSHPFCRRCERLRLDARGRIFRCLMDGRPLDLAALLRSGDGQQVGARVVQYLGAKSAPVAMDKPSTMCSIGG
jgi:cyclic pyranopterin phosphate synthase